MRGQVDYSKVINGNLSAEIEHINGMFQEKQQELQSAVLKVDQLTQQLEDLRRGKLNGLQALSGQVTGTAALELRKLYQELQIRNKLNQEQNTKLQQHKDLLNKRNMEVTLMDKRIGELRERLYKKKAELNRINGTPPPQPAQGSSGRVAAVGPYIQVPAPGRQEGSYAIPADPLKPQSLTVSATATHARSKSANDATWPTLTKQASSSLKPPSMDWKESNMDTAAKPGSAQPGTPTSAPDKGSDPCKAAPPVPALSKPPPPSYGTYPSPVLLPAGSSSSLERRKDGSLPRAGASSAAWQRPAAPPGSSQQIQQRISVPPSPTFQPAGSPLFPPGEARPDPPLAVAVRPFIPDKGSRPQSPRKGPPTVNSSSIYYMYLQQAVPPKTYQPNSKSAVKAVYGKPVLHSGSASSSPLLFLQGAPCPGGQQGSEEGEPEGQPAGPREGPPSVDNIPRPLSPTKLTPMVYSPLRYQSDAELEALRKRLANAPRPLKKRSSITEPEGPSGPNIQKLLYQRFNTLAGGMESAGGGGTPFYQPAPPPDYMGGVLADVDNGNTANANLPEPPALSPAPPPEPPRPAAERPPSPPPSSDANDNQLPPPPTEELTPGPPVPPPQTTEDSNNNPAAPPRPADTLPSPIPEASSPEEAGTPPQPSASAAQPAVKRTNLKKPNSERTGHGLRVKFNPLALLLDASLEGEFDLVQRIIYEVENPSTPNDEGITPLHNAVCAGHHHIVKFLLDFGVNVNAADSDGWTPLHCAASCNSVHLCKLLVESGAAIFATTISDVETAADKCEEMEEGYIQCSQFLYGVQEKLGVMNKGTVYALWDYEAQNSDELSFREGDAVTILRRKDDSETAWWWGRLNDKEGYVPRNLLGLYPRIKPRQRSLA